MELTQKKRKILSSVFNCDASMVEHHYISTTKTRVMYPEISQTTIFKDSVTVVSLKCEKLRLLEAVLNEL